MLKHQDSAAIVAVTDTARARQFYGTTLGLELVDGDDNVMRFRTGATILVVYKSAFAGTNQANAVVWGVGDQFDGIMVELQQKGVIFEHYDMMERDGDVHGDGTFKAAWFKDPDNNLLHLNNMG